MLGFSSLLQLLHLPSRPILGWHFPKFLRWKESGRLDSTYLLFPGPLGKPVFPTEDPKTGKNSEDQSIEALASRSVA
jgi:hypothetical protein